MALPPLAPRVRAPDVPPDLEWLNVARPLTLAERRGKMVVLDFWTFCCINCLHVLPDLKALERTYPRELVVIGVHSAKFPNEREAGQIRQAILRYGVAHPVANDRDLRVWRAYGVRAWPTLAVIDPEGDVCATVSGEGHLAELDETVALPAGMARREARLDETPLALLLERDRAGPTALSSPGKVLPDEASGRLFVADSGHHRVVVADREGNTVAVAGAGQPGSTDGPFESATFDYPQGLALDGGPCTWRIRGTTWSAGWTFGPAPWRPWPAPAGRRGGPGEAGRGRAVALNSPGVWRAPGATSTSPWPGRTRSG